MVKQNNEYEKEHQSEKITRLIANAEKFSNVIKKYDFERIIRNFITINRYVENVGMKVFNYFDKFDYSIFDRFYRSLSSFGYEFATSFRRLEDGFQNTLYKAKWFPHAINTESIQLFFDVSEIVKHTRDSQNRIKKLDRLFYNFYSKKRLDRMKREWNNNNDIPVYIKKMLSQAVNAYYRKEYALTNSVLMTLWEGIIASKVGAENDYRVSRKTRQSLSDLNDENENRACIKAFCDDFVFYDCPNIAYVKDDVPGRHGIAHSWYKQYPSKKTALNAIIFTDFLIGLKPIIEQ